MKTLRSLLLIAALAMAATSSFAADAATSRPAHETGATSKSILPKGYYAMMASYLKLTEPQQLKIKELLDAHDATWGPATPKGKQLVEADKTLKEAREAKKAGKPVDEAKIDAAKKTRAGLQPSFNEAHKALMESVQNVLTPEQREKWAGHELWMHEAARFKGVKWTPDQKAQIDALAIAAAKDYDKATNKAGRETVMDKFQAEVEKLMTPEQKAAMKAAPATKPAK